MHDLLESFISTFFKNHGKSPSPLFVESARRYLCSSDGAAVSDDEVGRAIKTRSARAYLAYRRMAKDSVTKMLCYVLASVGDSALSVVEELSRDVKKGALGLEVSYFAEPRISLLKESVDTHVYGVAFQIYQNACIYKKLRSETSPGSRAHLHFYQIVRDELERYERSVVEQRGDLLSFFAGMYSPYMRLRMVHQLNECFRDNPKKPFDFLRFNFRSNHPFHARVLESSCLHINRCLREFLLRGVLADNMGEFFICRTASDDPWEEFSIDFGLLPYFVSNRVAEKILYVGKCASLLGRCGPVQADDSEAGQMSILSPGLEEDVDAMLHRVNLRIEQSFLADPRVCTQVEGMRRVFLFGRCDFIETLFLYLKDSRDLSGKSFSYILDMAIRNTYGGVDEFTSGLGVYLVDNENKYENFALFCQAEYPTSLIVTKESILKLVAVFQFLWKLKRVEHLLLRVSRMGLKRAARARVASYTTLVYKVSYFVFEEVIGKRWRLFSADSKMPLNDLRLGMERGLDRILDECQIGRGIDHLLDAMKVLLMGIGTGASAFDDSEVQRSLCELAAQSGNEFIGTSLYDLHKYTQP